MLWDFKSQTGNEILAWASRLSSRDRAALNQKLDMLERLDFGQAVRLKLLDQPVKKTGEILALRAVGDTAMRPLLCRGPQVLATEYTLLQGAVEIESRLQPDGCWEGAMQNRAEVEKDHAKRTEHERA